MVSFEPSQYPSEILVVTALKKEDQQRVFLERSGNYPVHHLKSWRRTCSKAAMISALDTFAESLEAIIGSGTEACDPAEVLEVELQPKRRVLAKEAISENKLILVPMTCNVSYVKEGDASFLKTDNEAGDGEVIALTPVFKPPPVGGSDPDDGKDYIVEYFWLVRRNDKKEKTNMRLGTAVVTTATAVNLQEGKRLAGDTANVNVPFMLPSRDIQKGEELILFHEELGLKPIKRAKVPGASD